MLREENERVRNQNVKLRKRLENLQRKIEFDAQKKPSNYNNAVSCNMVTYLFCLFEIYFDIQGDVAVFLVFF